MSFVCLSFRIFSNSNSNSKGLLTMKYTYIITTQCIVTFSTNENKGCYINSQYFPQYIYIIIISLYGGLIPTGICGLYQ